MAVMGEGAGVGPVPGAAAAGPSLAVAEPVEPPRLAHPHFLMSDPARSLGLLSERLPAP